MVNTYESCKKEVINTYMKKYERGKLLDAKKNPITNHKQAVAIALSLAEKKCKDKINDNDYESIELKINKSIKNKKPINLSTLKKTTILLSNLSKNNKSKKVKVIQKRVILKVLNDIKNGSYKTSVINELIKIINL